MCPCPAAVLLAVAAVYDRRTTFVTDMAESRILITQNGTVGVINIIREGTVQNAFPFKKAYQELLKKGVTEFVIDLNSCELIDDTFLGILLGLGLEVKQKGSCHVRVFKANESLLTLFRGVGLDRLFN